VVAEDRARIGEVEAAKIGDLDESRKAWLVRAKGARGRTARRNDLYRIVVDLLPAREDRDLEAPLFPIGSADNLRMAVGRACRDAGIPSWSPDDLRHRRISLLHQQGESWAEIGANVGQRNLSVTADRYTHATLDHGEIDRPKLLERVRVTQTPGHTPEAEIALFAGKF
jgi:integrase